ncbi:AlbA family DNA-binding domain-containing protein [Serinibacter salmoneus]|uniref:Putative DNA-binding protein n=1 Tax=Serinibacter salmoneus TaxID=556530 RepID=A0A2A9D049_9MICO|nr:ATP-binding protein [Serinibacter salmoneus]PFG20044.1 putative DNA-binding protein [Serinibacter salmoneus]
MIGQVPLWVVALGPLLALVMGWVFATIARLVLRRRARLNFFTSIVVAMVGASVGMLLAELTPAPNLGSPLVWVLSLGMSIAFTAGYGWLVAHLQQPERASVAELLRRGESDGVEFKSTARVNLHTGKRDEKMEMVIAKTIAAFLNAGGGTLLIGVDDDGRALGLEADLALMKQADLDRYELWLRDHLEKTLGQNATASVRVSFEQVAASEADTETGASAGLEASGEVMHPVCRVDIGSSPRPVYLRAKGAPTQLWVRTGNSTRQLSVDEATEYVMERWPMGMGATLAAQVRAVGRFSGEG